MSAAGDESDLVGVRIKRGDNGLYVHLEDVASLTESWPITTNVPASLRNLDPANGVTAYTDHFPPRPPSPPEQP